MSNCPREISDADVRWEFVSSSLSERTRQKEKRDTVCVAMTYLYRGLGSTFLEATGGVTIVIPIRSRHLNGKRNWTLVSEKVAQGARIKILRASLAAIEGLANGDRRLMVVPDRPPRFVTSNISLLSAASLLNTLFLPRGSVCYWTP